MYCIESKSWYGKIKCVYFLLHSQTFPLEANEKTWRKRTALKSLSDTAPHSQTFALVSNEKTWRLCSKKVEIQLSEVQAKKICRALLESREHSVQSLALLGQGCPVVGLAGSFTRLMAPSTQFLRANTFPVMYFPKEAVSRFFLALGWRRLWRLAFLRDFANSSLLFRNCLSSPRHSLLWVFSTSLKKIRPRTFLVQL